MVGAPDLGGLDSHAANPGVVDTIAYVHVQVLRVDGGLGSARRGSRPVEKRAHVCALAPHLLKLEPSSALPAVAPSRNTAAGATHC